MNKTVFSLATVVVSSVAGTVMFTATSPEFQSVANAEPSSPQLSSSPAYESKDATLAGHLETIAKQRSAATKPAQAEESREGISKLHAYDHNGREAVTVYVRNIPVATFFGNENDAVKAPKVAAVGNVKVVKSSVAMDDAAKFANAVNAMNRDGFDASKIGVKWDSAAKQYKIHVDQTPLLAMTGKVSLPQTTKDSGEDALQIANLLRRQIGNVEPLKVIEGKPASPTIVAAAPTNVTRYQDGWASWYGPGFDGNYTASGARFNRYELTAAHRTLPFGTRVRVTNLDTGRSVVVTVNDRGPFIHDRVIDLSQGAAQVIGVVNSGVAPVRLDIVQ